MRLPALLLALLPLSLPSPLRGEGKNKRRDPLIGSAVRSDRYQIRREPHAVEELSGDVVYRGGGRTLRADWALYDHKTRLLRARGDIRAEERLPDGGRLAVRGERGAYDAGSGAGRVLGASPDGSVSLERFGPDGGATGRGGGLELAFNSRSEEASLAGGAWFESWACEGSAPLPAEERRCRLSGKAGRITGLRGEGEAVLEGRRPVLAAVRPRWSVALQADRIQAREGTAEKHRVRATGDARGWIHLPEGLPR